MKKTLMIGMLAALLTGSAGAALANGFDVRADLRSSDEVCAPSQVSVGAWFGDGAIRHGGHGFRVARDERGYGDVRGWRNDRDYGDAHGWRNDRDYGEARGWRNDHSYGDARGWRNDHDSGDARGWRNDDRNSDRFHAGSFRETRRPVATPDRRW